MKEDPGRSRRAAPSKIQHRRSGSRWWTIPFFGDPDRLPLRPHNRDTDRRRKRQRMLFLIFLGLLGWPLWYWYKNLGVEQLERLAYSQFIFRHDDADYMAADAAQLCRLESVLMEDYREYGQREQSTEGQESEVTKNYIRQRPKIALNRLVYFELLTRDRVRLIYDNGACDIFEFKDLLYNIQEAGQCNQFQGIPREGSVSEYVNLLYIESFERVICEERELYRAQLGIRDSSCGPLQVIKDCGVGLFSVYIYRKLRRMAEELNPHSSFKYRRTVELEGCEC